MLKFLVTGAAGQLGKDVVRELENRGYEVTGSGSKKRKTAGRYVKMEKESAHRHLIHPNLQIRV